MNYMLTIPIIALIFQVMHIIILKRKINNKKKWWVILLVTIIVLPILHYFLMGILVVANA